MSKTAQERFDEIQKEIWQISESYTLIKQNIDKEQYPNSTKYEHRHILLLQMRLNCLIKELNELRSAGEITIPLLYKNIINSLKGNLVEDLGGEYQEAICAEIRLNLDLF